MTDYNIESLIQGNQHTIVQMIASTFYQVMMICSSVFHLLTWILWCTKQKNGKNYKPKIRKGRTESPPSHHRRHCYIRRTNLHPLSERIYILSIVYRNNQRKQEGDHLQNQECYQIISQFWTKVERNQQVKNIPWQNLIRLPLPIPYYNWFPTILQQLTAEEQDIGKNRNPSWPEGTTTYYGVYWYHTAGKTLKLSRRHWLKIVLLWYPHKSRRPQ